MLGVNNGRNLLRTRGHAFTKSFKHNGGKTYVALQNSVVQLVLFSSELIDVGLQKYSFCGSQTSAYRWNSFSERASSIGGWLMCRDETIEATI